MRVLIVLLFVSLVSFSKAQDAQSFDFWLGEWDCFWLNSSGDTVKGSNSITNILDGKVIQENFADPSRNFKGMSVSVYNPQSKTWHQAWVDNQGGYYDFVGIFNKSSKIFSTDTTQEVIERMKFYEIQSDAFIWDWEKSTDGGKEYKLNWRIFYKRKSD